MIFIRHGEDTPNLRGGWSQAELTDRGIVQAVSLGQKLLNSPMKYERIITSDLLRAKQTAEIINSFLNLSISENKSWREINIGDLQGMPKEFSDKKYPNHYLEKMGIDQCYPNGESPRMLYNRIEKAFLEFDVYNDDKTIIVTHGGPIMVILHILLGIDWVSERRWFRIKKCGVVEIASDQGMWTLRSCELYEEAK